MACLPLATIFGMSPLAIGLWVSLLLVTATLLVLMRTQWGRARPTHRYVLLSIVAHLLVICVATTIRFRPAPVGDGPAPVQVRIVVQAAQGDPLPEEETAADNLQQEQAPAEPAPTPTPEPEPPVDVPAPDPPAASAPPEPTPTLQANDLPTPEAPEAPSALAAPPLMAAAEPVADPATPPLPDVPVERLVPLAPLNAEPVATQSLTASQSTAPPAIREREGEERLRRLLESGGDAHTEDAVASALAWIATAQSPDGRWDADRWSAGRERGAVLGHQRTGVGLQADTAVTGLSLLALMGAGHTHQDGPFTDVIRDGLAYLVRTQGNDGNLFGGASLFAQTYCHSMATFALAEAYAVTGDPRLAAPVRRATEFLTARQDPRTGGWRYRAGDPGDMSQLGWIMMALRSAEIAGVEIPVDTWEGMEHFVRSTQRGRYRGLASYRPSSTPSHSMTAESFYCRQILGMRLSGQTSSEALGAILQEPPGHGRPNLYAWYYATLALHHHRGASASADGAWQDWNSALKRTLIASQVTEGVNQGSWTPNTVWGRCGGRVYATAMATMCLEVYYRYNHADLVRDPWIAARPSASTLR